MNLCHVVIGPDGHGVTEYASALHQHTGGYLTQSLDDLPGDGPVHVTFTDHLFGPTPDEAVDAVLQAVGARPLSVSFHDIPQQEEGQQRFHRRARAYVRLAHHAQLVVCNSHHEASFFAQQDPQITVTVIHLPVPTDLAPLTAPTSPVADTVGILGFIYPGKGHDRILAAAGDLQVRALGGFSAGHEDLADTLPGLEVTGYLSDEDLSAEMARIAIPVCAHRHFSASGSLMRWLAAGRRVLVQDSDYTREIAGFWPELIYPTTDWATALHRAADDPDFATPIDPTSLHQWGREEVAVAWLDAWATVFGAELRHNRPPAPSTQQPGVSVIIPYFNDQDGLDAVLAGLEKQTYAGPIEVIVADDGSTTAPRTDTCLPVTVVRQHDQGFRAAAARNLGASVASHPVLAFLDGDTVPAPEYLAVATRRVHADARVVVVGAREQYDPTSGTSTQPRWLLSGWEHTANLQSIDATSWRYVISAVLTCSAEFFAHVGGFDGTIVGYGGEDWVFGWQCYNHGAIFVHEPAARATHRDDEWATRHTHSPDLAVAEKNSETLALATRISHHTARPDGVVFATADTVVSIPNNGADWPAGVLETVIANWLAAGDIHVRIDPVPQLFAEDPRVSPSAGGRVDVRLHQPAAPPAGAWTVMLDRIEALGGQALLRAGTQDVCTVTTPRARRNEPPAVIPTGWAVYHDPIRLERTFANW